MTRILVTGASGFVGGAVVAAFVRSGRAVRAAVRRAPGASFPAGVEMVQHPEVPLAQSFDWTPYLEGVDQVVHLAGIAHTGGVAPERYDRVNRRATAELAAAAAQRGIRHFVFIWSIRAQTGPSADHALTERDEPAPTDPYGRSKVLARPEAPSPIRRAVHDPAAGVVLRPRREREISRLLPLRAALLLTPPPIKRLRQSPLAD